MNVVCKEWSVRKGEGNSQYRVMVKTNATQNTVISNVKIIQDHFYHFNFQFQGHGKLVITLMIMQGNSHVKQLHLYFSIDSLTTHEAHYTFTHG